MIKLLIIDNYDSFTYNLEHLFGQLPGVEVSVVRNDDDFIPKLDQSVYDGVIISPGPGSPLDKEYFGRCSDVINDFGKKGLPILGICLGFQGIAVSFGASLKQAALPQHGKTSELKIIKPGKLLENIPDKIEVMRYHSLMIDPDQKIPSELVILAEVDPRAETVKANGREIMVLRHKSLPIFGAQFHPESYGTELGQIMAKNFVNILQGKN